MSCSLVGVSLTLGDRILSWLWILSLRKFSIYWGGTFYLPNSHSYYSNSDAHRLRLGTEKWWRMSSCLSIWYINDHAHSRNEITWNEIRPYSFKDVYYTSCRVFVGSKLGSTWARKPQQNLTNFKETSTSGQLGYGYSTQNKVTLLIIHHYSDQLSCGKSEKSKDLSMLAC